jgi:hypothetical protein
MFGQDDLAHMNPDSVQEMDACFVAELAQAGLEEEPKADGIGRGGKGDEEGITGGFDLLAGGKAGQEFSDQLMMVAEKSCGSLIPQLLFEGGGANGIGEQEGD